jgi:hypothetical protein
MCLIDDREQRRQRRERSRKWGRRVLAAMAMIWLIAAAGLALYFYYHPEEIGW